MSIQGWGPTCGDVGAFSRCPLLMARSAPVTNEYALNGHARATASGIVGYTAAADSSAIGSSKTSTALPDRRLALPGLVAAASTEIYGTRPGAAFWDSRAFGLGVIAKRVG